MTFEEGQTYKHRTMKDAYIRVTAVHTQEPKFTKLEVEWLHTGCGHSFGRDAITVKGCNYDDWVRV